MDPDIVDSKKNLALVEDIMDHKWEFHPDDHFQEPPYNTPSLTQLNAEVKLEDDPICSSAGCVQYLHPKPKGNPMDYFVPNFGADNLINDATASLKWAENSTGHAWNWHKPVPLEIPEYKE